MGKDTWIFFNEVDFSNKGLNQFHVDTRDFFCNAFDKEFELKIKTSINKIKKYPKRFFHTETEIVELLTRYYNESGGSKDWRYISLDGNEMRNWRLKYIRIYRTELGLVVCDKDGYVLRKEKLAFSVNKDLLLQ